MIQSVLSGSVVFVFSFIAWFAALGALAVARGLPRVMFVTFHWSFNVVLFAAIFWVYFRYVHHFSPFGTMAIAMGSLFAIELVFWRFFYHGPLWFLNFWDWIVPAFLVASSIYWVGTWLGTK